ncbi:hypothetical protein [Chishuiella changwenlii]|nr:hypothetical protein [Chishuiella changwenlii]
MKKQVILSVSVICGLLLFSCNDDDLNNKQNEEIKTTTLSPRTYEQKKENFDSIQKTRTVDPDRHTPPQH